MEEETKFDEEGNPIPSARYNYMTDEAIRGDDGFWTVIRVARQAITYNNKDVYVREVSFKSIDRSMQGASRTTLMSLRRVLKEYNEDFWSKEDWEYKQYLLTQAEPGEEALDVVTKGDENSEA